MVAQHIGTFDWGWAKGMLPVGKSLTEVTIDQGEMQKTTRRIERHKTHEGFNCGWVSFPRPGGKRVLLTNDMTEEGLTVRPGTAVDLCDTWAAQMAGLRRSGDSRDPSASDVWNPF